MHLMFQAILKLLRTFNVIIQKDRTTMFFFTTAILFERKKCLKKGFNVQSIVLHEIIQKISLEILFFATGTPLKEKKHFAEKKKETCLAGVL